MVGISSAEAARLFAQYGPNEIEEKQSGGFIKLLRAFVAPASLMLIAASVLSFVIGRSFDGYFILLLLALNVGISFWHEHKADRALEVLRAQLKVEARVLRDGVWRSIESRLLVPGDVVECGVGVLVPADVRIMELNNLQINEAVLTGESLPKEKKMGDTAYSGSVVTTGIVRGEVVATGNQAYFGKIATSASGKKRRSSMEKDILSISRYLIVASLIAVAILTTVFLFDGQPLADILLLDLSLLIAGIPISLPTVMTLIVSLGAVSLAKKQALVRRLASLEDFANVTLLLTDKTGTLTESKISVERVKLYDSYDENKLLCLAGFTASSSHESLINAAIEQKAHEAMSSSKAEVVAYTPPDSVRKRTTALLAIDGTRYLVAVGTPPVLESFSRVSPEQHEQLAHDIADASREGSRIIAVAIKENPSGLDDEKDMTLAGFLVLSDPLRIEARETLTFLKKEGVNAIMVTGDTKETAAHVASMLGMTGTVFRAADVDFATLSRGALADASVFAEVLPEDKLKLIERAQKDFTVAMAGDGINDLPAVRRADVGMAVANAVDALKGVADIVFLAPGISVMQTALVEARKIFFRLYGYSIYRISESFRLIVTALVLGLIIKGFPLTPVQIILLAFLNDIPIITLAFDRVRRSDRPADLKPRERFTLGTLYGLVGVANSVLLYFFMADVLHLPLAVIQTMFFLKLTVGGHLLVYVAHTKERWWKFLPAGSVITATALTQLCATALALFGIFVAPISLGFVVFVWLWAFCWMQVSELMKMLNAKLGYTQARL
jgi:H+-transporting ATPase